MPYAINGTEISLQNEPQLKDGTLWVPLRGLSEALGAKVDWDPDNQVAILYHGPHVVTVKIGDTTVDVDGEKLELQAAPYLDSGDSWVPAKFFDKPLGYNVNADWQNKKVEIVNPNG